MASESMTRIDILMKPSLSRKEVEELEGVKSSRANQIMEICRNDFGGSISYRRDRITTRSYFAFNGEDYDKWLKAIGGK